MDRTTLRGYIKEYYNYAIECRKKAQYETEI